MTGKSETKSKNTTKKGGILNFFGGVKAEVKKITWPSKNDTKKALIAVAIFSLGYMILIGGLDFIFQNLFEMISKLK
jgi:preprotein translocase subunit SecE